MGSIGGVHFMAGLTFYWISWVFWIFTTFFMKKGSQLRLVLSIWILLMIVISPHSFFLFNFEISFVTVLLIGSLFFCISLIKGRKAVYVLLSSFITMIAYACFHLFELFDPVWLIMPRNSLLALLLLSLSVILHSNKIYSIMIILLGSIHGEFLYAYILKKYSFPYLIGSLDYLDAVALSSALLGVWIGFEKFAAFYENYFNQVEKEKQKLS